MQHPWMKMDVTAIPDVVLANSLAQLKRFQARRRLKKAINAVRVTVRTRMLLASKAARVAKAEGKGDEEVTKIFFEAARAAVPPRMPTLPPPLAAPISSPRAGPQFRVSNIVTPPPGSVYVPPVAAGGAGATPAAEVRGAALA